MAGRWRSARPDGEWKPPLLPAPLWLPVALLIAVLLVAGVVTAVHADPQLGSPAGTPTPLTATRSARPTSSPTPIAIRTRDPAAPPDAEAVVTTASAIQVLSTPGGAPVITLANPNSYGGPLVLLVIGQRPGWYQVSLPIRPNGSTGWVKASAVDLDAVPYQLTLSQRTHTVVVWHDGREVRTLPTSVGKAATPSPNGLFFVDVILDNRKGDQAYGPWALGLSGFSDVYTTFNGGDAEIALHGTDEDSSVGTSASHGCFRLHNADATWLAHTVTLGTPVYVTA